MDDIKKIKNGANFVRADLHIHSFGFDDGSFDVKDENMTPEKIVDKAIAANLSVISITDHNEIGNSKKAIEYVKGKSLLVVPGIEVSTTQGHLLVYFDNYQDLRNFHGKLSISEDKQRCNQGIVECLNLADQYGGFGILAHIDLDSGFDKVIGRYSGVIEDVLCHSALLALEISKKESFHNLTDKDGIPERRNLVTVRRQRLNLHDSAVLPKVMSSDSHTLDKLGTNAEGEKKLTRFKVDELSFDSIKIALLMHESRVRIEDTIPERIPHFVGMKIKGGILNGQSVRFSKNLNCIIGGRGTGKSTLLESLRETSGNKSMANVVDSDVWPDEIELIFEDETGKQTTFKRSKNSSSYNATDSEDGIVNVVIESYGQGETAETIQHSDKDPSSLLKFLDSFIDINFLEVEDSEVCELLLDNQSAMSKLRIEVAGIDETRRQISSLNEKRNRLERDKVGELVIYQMSLVSERTIRDELVSDLGKLIKSYKVALKDTEIFEYFEKMSEEQIIVGKKEFSEVKKLVKEFSEIVAEKSMQLDHALEGKVDALKVQLRSWKERESEIQKDIDKKKEDLESAGIPFDIGKINQIASDLEFYNRRLRKLNEDQKSLANLQKDRIALNKRRRDIKSEIYKKRHLFSLKINENLKNSVDGFHVSAKYSQGCYSPQFEAAIKQLMEWRTSQVPKSVVIAGNVSPIEFCERVKKKDISILKEYKDAEGRRVFADDEIAAILERSINNNAYEDFETLKFEDKPKLLVTKVIKDAGETRSITRSIAQLSLGQQQSILLAILIQSESSVPLLIDQPEDNLDSEFIFKTIVDNLRNIKEKRQVIVVTHNANIAVLGDAELVVPLKSTSEKTLIVNSGSIDRSAVRKECCTILEGGERAFLSRQKIYNIDG